MSGSICGAHTKFQEPAKLANRVGASSPRPVALVVSLQISSEEPSRMARLAAVSLLAMFGGYVRYLLAFFFDSGALSQHRLGGDDLCPGAHSTAILGIKMADAERDRWTSIGHLQSCVRCPRSFMSHPAGPAWRLQLGWLRSVLYDETQERGEVEEVWWRRITGDSTTLPLWTVSKQAETRAPQTVNRRTIHRHTPGAGSDRPLGLGSFC